MTEKLTTDEQLTTAALVRADMYDRERTAQCWADDIVGRPGPEENDVCQEAGPFACRLGLCPRHCEGVH